MPLEWLVTGVVLALVIASAYYALIHLPLWVQEWRRRREDR